MVIFHSYVSLPEGNSLSFCAKVWKFHFWLVVSTPFEIYLSDWIIIAIIGENKIHVPNHQPDFLCFLSASEYGFSDTLRATWTRAVATLVCPFS